MRVSGWGPSVGPALPALEQLVPQPPSLHGSVAEAGPRVQWWQPCPRPVGAQWALTSHGGATAGRAFSADRPAGECMTPGHGHRVDQQPGRPQTRGSATGHLEGEEGRDSGPVGLRTAHAKTGGGVRGVTLPPKKAPICLVSQNSNASPGAYHEGPNLGASGRVGSGQGPKTGPGRVSASRATPGAALRLHPTPTPGTAKGVSGGLALRRTHAQTSHPGLTIR